MFFILVERGSQWSPPVLWRRFENGLASICILILSGKMPKESETTGLNDACAVVKCPFINKW